MPGDGKPLKSADGHVPTVAVCKLLLPASAECPADTEGCPWPPGTERMQDVRHPGESRSSGNKGGAVSPLSKTS